MKCRTVYTPRDEEFLLTETEEKYVRALERLAKMNPGRIRLMGSGDLSVRINDCWADDNIDGYVNCVGFKCEGGDGGDNKTMAYDRLETRYTI